jgi:MYXO-CTERM domain-containing protein
MVKKEETMKIVALIAGAVTVALAGSATADFYEDFNGGGDFPWEVVDLAADGESDVLGWDYNYNIIDGGDARGNFTTGDGGAAMADTDAFGSGGGEYNIAMVSPWSFLGPEGVLNFWQHYRPLGGDMAHVEITTDGTNWENLATYTEGQYDSLPSFPYTEDIQLGVETTIDLSNYANNDVRVRFRYQGDGWNWWWQVDNVGMTSIPGPGALALLGVAGLASRRRRR